MQTTAVISGGSHSSSVWALTSMQRSAAPAVDRARINDRMSGLIEAVAAGADRQAFAELFQHFAPRLKAFIMRQGGDPAAAEELAQEAMLSVWRRASTFDRARASASTWVFTILRNKRIDMLRRQAAPHVGLEAVAERADEGALPDDDYAAGQAGDMLRTAMTDLPAEQAEVVRKAFYEDKSHSEIAKELEIPLGTVKSRIRQALARLRAAVPEGTT